jgi:hypothetical protein
MQVSFLLELAKNSSFLWAMFFGGLANACAFLVLYRMKILGYQVGWWRTHRDWDLYRQYWRIAPGRKWSRAPLIVGILSFAIAAGFFLSMVLNQSTGSVSLSH